MNHHSIKILLSNKTHLRKWSTDLSKIYFKRIHYLNEGSKTHPRLKNWNPPLKYCCIIEIINSNMEKYYKQIIHTIPLILSQSTIKLSWTHKLDFYLFGYFYCENVKKLKPFINPMFNLKTSKANVDPRSFVSYQA